MNGKSSYSLRSFGRIDMFDQVDGSTSVQRSLSSTTSAASNEQPDTPADSNAGPQQCGVETVDSRPIETPPTSAPVTISTVSTGAFVPYTGPNQTNKPDLMDSKGSKLNIYDLLNLKKSKVKPAPNLVPCLAQEPDHLEYFMEHERRGKCVIINNRRFDSPSLHDRKGTEVDGKHLVECFRNLDFEIKLIEDKKAKDIRSEIFQIASQDFSNDDCFVCCVLTHGELNSLWARDERYVIDLILEPFRGDNCKTLAGKPKLFFIQACQGDKLDRGMTVRFDDVEDSNATSFFRIPTWADFMIAFSTVPGYYSWRNTTNGSWFVQALVKTLNSHWKTHDLLSILTMTSHRVAYDYESYVPNDPDFDKKKQIPCIKSMLTRRIVFKPKKAIVVAANNVLEEKTDALINLLNEKNNELKQATDSQLQINLKISQLSQEIGLLQQHLHQVFVQREMQKLNLNGRSAGVGKSSAAAAKTSNSARPIASSYMSSATVAAAAASSSSSSGSSVKVEVVHCKPETFKKSEPTKV